MSTNLCIYSRPQNLCAGNSALSDEHYLPRALGNFRGYEQLRGKICEGCNVHLSKLDEILVRLGPEALLRAGHGIKGRKKHRESDSFHEGTHGHRPLEVNAWLPNDTSPTRLEILPGNIAQPRRELIFESEGGEKRVVTVPHKVNNINDLNEHLRRSGITEQPWPRIEVNCAADDQEFVSLMEERFGKIDSGGKVPDYTGYPATVRAATFIKLPPEYHLAIAKIAFHFFIWCFSPPLTGLEDAFDDIKAFLYNGGDPSKFVTCGAGPIDRDQTRIPTWTHVLAAGWAHEEMIATVQLFAGSDLGMSFIAGSGDGRDLRGDMKNTALIWFVRLGRTKLSYPLRKALAFVGYKERRDGFDGEVQELRAMNGRGGQFWR
jgi:hypothetical protein